MIFLISFSHDLFNIITHSIKKAICAAAAAQLSFYLWLLFLVGDNSSPTHEPNSARTVTTILLTSAKWLSTLCFQSVTLCNQLKQLPFPNTPADLALHLLPMALPHALAAYTTTANHSYRRRQSIDAAALLNSPYTGLLEQPRLN